MLNQLSFSSFTGSSSVQQHSVNDNIAYIQSTMRSSVKRKNEKQGGSASNSTSSSVISIANSNYLQHLVSEADISTQVSEQIKRCRITSTPGELRLKRDLSDYDGSKHILYRFTDEPNSVVVSFNDYLTQYTPSYYLVIVPRYYPHEPPTVSLVDSTYKKDTSVNMQYVSTYFDSNSGVLNHRSLQPSTWRATNDMHTVLDALLQVRTMIFECKCNDYTHDVAVEVSMDTSTYTDTNVNSVANACNNDG